MDDYFDSLWFKTIVSRLEKEDLNVFLNLIEKKKFEKAYELVQDKISDLDENFNDEWAKSLTRMTEENKKWQKQLE